MNSNSVYFAYILFSLISCFFLIRHANSRYFVGLCIIWLFSVPILDNPDFSITIPLSLTDLSNGFDLTASRLLFFGMLPLVAIYLKNRVRNSSFESSHRLDFFLVVYFVVIVIVQFINFRELQSNTLLINLVAALNFLFIYFLAKWQIREKDFKVLKQAFLLFSVISAFVGIIQFTIDPFFLRFGATRLAFGDLLRANGLTNAEYTQGAMMIIALVIANDLYKNKLFKFGLFCLFTVAAFFTMLRLTWAILIMIVVGIIGFQLRRHLRILIFSSAFIGLFGIAVFVNLGTEINLAFVNTGFAKRLFADTLSGREVYYANVPEIALANPLGIASYTNPVYNQWAVDSGIIGLRQTATAIHNGLLATLVKFGVAGLISFVVFYGYVLVFGLNLYKTNPKTGLFLLLLCVIYLGYNATNDFSFSAGQNLPMILNLFLGSIISLENKQFMAI